MDCLVSAVAARVVFIEGNDVKYIEADQPTIETRTTLAEVPLLLADAYDVVLLKNTSTSAALERLLDLWNCDRALRMLDIILDSTSENSEVLDASSYLAAFLANKSVRAWLLDRTFATPYDSGVDFGALADTLKPFPATLGFVSHLNAFQNQIRQVRIAWDRISDSAFGSATNRSAFEFHAVSRGAFRRLAEAVGDPSAVNNAVFSCYHELRTLPNYRAVIGEWTTPFLERSLKPTIKLSDREEDEESEPFIADESGPIHETYISVKTQQRGIIQQLERGNVSQARRFAVQLVDSQLQTGGSEYAAMSLCLLAQEAKRLNLSSLQLQWAQRAVDLAPDDARTHGQAGDAYLSFYRLNEAIKEYEIARSLTAEPFGASGLARVLRIRGRFDDALQACIDIRSKYFDHPDIYRTWALQGEVLRDMWRFEEALAIYQEARRQFPNERVLWCGTAAVLHDMGALPEALDAYAAAVKRFPDDPVARGGHADTLKTLGQLTLALSEYESAIAEFPAEAVLLCGKADVLRTMGRFDEAATVYKFAISRFPYEPTAYCGYADTQRESGNVSEALEAYEKAIRVFPDDPRCHTGRAAVLRFAGRFEEALQAFDKTTRDFPYELYSLVGRANLLKLLGRTQDALNAYDVVMQRRPDYAPAKYGKAAVFVLIKEFGAADVLLPRGEVRTSSEWVGLHIRGMMYLKRDEIDKAIEIFTHGSIRSPFYREQQFFKTALATAKIRKKQFREAIDLIHRLDTPIAHILRMHSFAELGDTPRAQSAYNAVNDNAPPSVTLLRNAVAGYYGLKKQKTSYSNGWILDQELDVLLQAA